LKLESFVPGPGRSTGVLLKARINGGRPLHLLLDSGAEHLVVTNGTARAAGLSTGTALSLVGFGRLAEKAGAFGVARTVDVGPLSFRDCPVDVVDHKVVDGADGVLPLVLFSDFLVRLDFPARVLDLTPYQSAAESHGRFTRALAVNAVLFLRIALDGAHTGYFLLDTGAAHNALSRSAARALGGPGLAARMKLVQGAGGVSEAPQVSWAVHFRTAGQDIASDDVVLVDLDTMSRYNGLEVAGLLGYPALSRYVVTVNYRDSLIRMETGAAPPEPGQ
jgi:predicted aspartyl protease